MILWFMGETISRSRAEKKAARSEEKRKAIFGYGMFDWAKSAFETSVTAGVNMSGASNGAFGLFGDPYGSVAANHTVGVCWWYNGVVSQALSDQVYDQYATRFGY